MDKQKPSKLVYPIEAIQIGNFPLLDELISRSQIVREKFGFDPGSQRQVLNGFGVIRESDVQEFLERARETGQLEPLTSLTYFILPDNAVVQRKGIQSFLLPYQQHVEAIMKELSQNISFQVQITQDNILGEVILRNGILIMKSGGNYVVYRYSVEKGATNPVAFERLPDLKSPDLETTVKKYHNPEFIESPVLVRVRKPYHIKEDILPYFAYMLTGIRR